VSGAPEPNVVREVAGFELRRPLGEGGMGRVFLARQRSLERDVALKVLHPVLAGDVEFVTRFAREGRAAARFTHPNVVKVIDAGRDARNGVYFIAFELLSGGSLEERLEAAGGRLPEAEVLRVARAVGEALRFAEEHDLVHRDIKPDNILFDADDVPKLADLGLARPTRDDEKRLTSTGVIMGTPHYMAPEQALGEEVDVRADLYALGLVLWRCLTGQVPFDEDGGASAMQVLSRRLDRTLPDVRDHAPEVSEETARLVTRLTARQPADRPASAAAFLRELGRRPSQRKPALPAGGPRSRPPWGAVAVVAAAAAPLVLAVALLSGSGETDPSAASPTTTPGAASPSPTSAAPSPPPADPPAPTSTAPPRPTPSPRPAASPIESPTASPRSATSPDAADPRKPVAEAVLDAAADLDRALLAVDLDGAADARARLEREAARLADPRPGDRAVIAWLTALADAIIEERRAAGQGDTRAQTEARGRLWAALDSRATRQAKARVEAVTKARWLEPGALEAALDALASLGAPGSELAEALYGHAGAWLQRRLSAYAVALALVGRGDAESLLLVIGRAGLAELARDGRDLVGLTARIDRGEAPRPTDLDALAAGPLGHRLGILIAELRAVAAVLRAGDAGPAAAWRIARRSPEPRESPLSTSRFVPLEGAGAVPGWGVILHVGSRARGPLVVFGGSLYLGLQPPATFVVVDAVKRSEHELFELEAWDEPAYVVVELVLDPPGFDVDAFAAGPDGPGRRREHRPVQLDTADPAWVDEGLPFQWPRRRPPDDVEAEVYRPPALPRFD